MDILLLGLKSSGKTEVGHLIVKKTRENFDSTNGVQSFTLKTQQFIMNITEVGGNKEMQKLWHHYFKKVKLWILIQKFPRKILIYYFQFY